MTKNLLGIILALSLLAGCNGKSIKNASDIASQSASKGDYVTQVKMIDSSFNFGQVTDGEQVVFSYRFQNAGDKPLIISAANASCGCTVPEKPEQPISVGEDGFIKIVFDSKGRVGPVHKTIQVISNAQPEFPVLQLIGQVLPAKQ